jgi:hypothetical protein
MWTELGAAIDAIHALAMTVWLLGLPLLFWRRWPRVSTAYGVYAVLFVVVTRVSHYALGECFLTRLSRLFWSAGPAGRETDEWFTVRFARLIFGLTPSHRLIALASEALILVTAIGVLVSLHGLRRAHDDRGRHAGASS